MAQNLSFLANLRRKISCFIVKRKHTHTQTTSHQPPPEGPAIMRAQCQNYITMNLGALHPGELVRLYAYDGVQVKIRGLSSILATSPFSHTVYWFLSAHLGAGNFRLNSLMSVEHI